MQEGSRAGAGLIGVGYISEYHAAAISRLPQVDLVGVYDIDAERARKGAAKLGTRAFDSLEAMRAAGATVMHVLTPPAAHADMAVRALDLGCHVLVEKPLAVSEEECTLIEQRAAERGLQVCVNHSLLYDPQVMAALNAVRQGKVGKVVSVDILRGSVYPPYEGGPLPPQYRSAGYPFRDLGIHALYLFQAFLGPIESVEAKWESLGGDPNLAFDEWRAFVACRDGMGQLQLTWNVKPIQSQIIIQGTNGVLRADLFLMFNALRSSGPLPKPLERLLNAFTDSTRPLVEVPVNAARFLAKRVLPYHGLQYLVADFYRALSAGSPVPVPPSDARAVVAWTERVAKQADREHEEARRAYWLTDSRPVLVTGASGSLGRAIVGRLVARGTRVRILVRRAPRSVPNGVEVAFGDLGNPEAVDAAVRGASIVIHVGAAMKGGWPEHLCGTVIGTRNVTESCVAHGVERLVHISSLSVVDWAGAPAGALVDEDTPNEPRAEERGPYTRAKLEAEQIVLACVREKGLRAVVLRPGQIFGGGIPLMTPAVARRAGKRWLVLGAGDLMLPLVYIDDVVNAVELAFRSSLNDGEILQLVDEVALTQGDVLRLMGARAIRVPRPLVFGLGRLSEPVFALLRRPSPIGAYRLRSALARRTFSNERAKRLLGWEPVVGVCEGIRRERELAS